MVGVLALLLSIAPASALVPPRATPAPATSRRALLGTAALFLAPAPSMAKAKEYMTLGEYTKVKERDRKDEELFDYFETLRQRAPQTAEFDALAGKGDLKGVSQLALAWENTVRKEALDKATEMLDKGAKEQGAALSKAVLGDLKRLDKLAKAGSGDDVGGASAALRGHVLEFVQLQPQRITQRYGDFGGGGSDSGVVEDL